ncbi:hypothetical protein [Roseofilum casamattae]|uniref:Uncharacterized protein n=1 Tax=Roseofilum casamattae BLCC-M143 TaxID=3022442 RepID=A0ABT7BYN1_9CYAN|nr:hypothetical protein [Roseofilum casamattae]MDJ1184305.1 hypothetical protein [Roseofilum casamattae BLCC-M143]
MERGLLWLPLLAVFIGLAIAGWREYQKVEVYREWAKDFDRSKYDVYAVLGQNSDRLTWGKPTVSGLADVQTIAESDVIQIRLLSDDRIVSFENPPSGKTVILQLSLNGEKKTVDIPFTDAQLAGEWGKYLEQEWLHKGDRT